MAAATRRWAALELPRHHRAQAPGGVGGLAEGSRRPPPYEWWNWRDEYGDAQPSREWNDQIRRGLEAADRDKEDLDPAGHRPVRAH
jgi:hypothetical protein